MKFSLKKLIASTGSAVIITGSLAPGASAIAQGQETVEELPATQSKSGIVNMTNRTEEIANTYVEVEDKKFTIENKTELKNKIGEEQFEEVLKQINYTNKQLSETNLSHALVDEIENTITVNANFEQTSDGPQLFAAVEGKDDIKFHWTYAEVWLSNSTSESILRIGTNAVSTALGGVSGKVAGAVAGTIIGGAVNEFVVNRVSKAVYFKIALLPPFHTWDIQAQ